METNNSNYKATISYTSKEISAKERVMLKDTGNAGKLDKLTDEGAVVTFEPDYYAVLQIHNDKANPTDYENYIIVDKDGNKYVTGSPSFYSKFLEIWEEMKDVTEPWSIEIYKRDSKNRPGKSFLSCSVV